MPPRPLFAVSSLRRLIVNATTATGLLLALACLPWLVRMSLGPLLAAAVGTTLMVRWAVSRATREPVDPRHAPARMVANAALFGVLNTAVAFSFAAMVETGNLLTLAMSFFVLAIGFPAAFAFGIVFGLLLTIPVTTLMTALRKPSPSASDATALVTGLWMALVALLTIIIEPMGKPIYGVIMGPPSVAYLPLQLGVVAVVGTAGLALAGLAGQRWWSRIRFVQRADAGLIDGYSVADRTDDDRSAALPCLGDADAQCTMVLMRHAEPGQAGYRGESSWPVARVPDSWLLHPMLMVNDSNE